MKYPIKMIQSNIDNNWVISVPDLPGCQVIDHSIDNALEKISTVIAEHLTILAEYGETIPHGSLLEQHIEQNKGKDYSWAIVDFDIIPYLGKSHKINVTLPELLIKQIDDKVKKSELYSTRSGFIASACLAQLTKTN